MPGKGIGCGLNPLVNIAVLKRLSMKLDMAFFFCGSAKNYLSSGLAPRLRSGRSALPIDRKDFCSYQLLYVPDKITCY